MPELSTTTDEGFLTTVNRDGVIRGPFKTIHEAITVAHAWNQELDIKTGQTTQDVDKETHVVVKTISESVAVQIEQPAENPPVIEQKTTT